VLNNIFHAIPAKAGIQNFHTVILAKARIQRRRGGLDSWFKVEKDIIQSQSGSIKVGE
jgi:hypothetical protein